ncbi:Hypothetical protein LUCI_2407 [Lucifera butyrica]|uniref:Uncharacterized protein n=1 Tax=Lucifera butyrica TaxID=1351585 RepID=A0A498RAL0_9FIRM|nr:hypothetical protein [Lucifera butyrica]VBB07163.1 Hypothetical protein LUCI_2407 [Lucifera butyrica]
MRLSSLYSYYRKFFNYPSNSSAARSRLYAFAIQDTTEVLTQAYENRSKKPIEDYRTREKKSGIALRFLEHAEELACSRCSIPLQDLEFIQGIITINEKFLSSTRRGIEIPFPYLLDNNNSDAVILTFGQPNNMLGEVEVLVGLINEFAFDGSWPNELETISYWDLSSGEEKTLKLSGVKPVSRIPLLEVLNRF